MSVEKIDTSSLNMRTHRRFLNFFKRAKKSDVSTNDIINIWNRFATKPEQVIFYKETNNE